MANNTINEQKVQLRQKVLKQRKQKEPVTFSNPSEIIEAYEVIALYFPVRGELDLYPIMEEIWKKNKVVLLPRVLNQHDMVFCPYDKKDQLACSPMGIKEPTTDPYLGSIDLFFVPGLVFGRDGTRLGYGAGFYDRFFMKHSHSIKIGVCYYEFLLDTVPTEQHDISMDYVFTEKGLIVI